jgi:hypothetical protein
LTQNTLIENTSTERRRPTPRFGWLEFLRRVREDQLSVLTPDLFGQDIAYSRILFLHSFLINKPEYIERVLLTHQRNYRKSDFLRRILGPLLGEGLLISEGEAWRRQRRIAAPAFHARRIAELVGAMTSCTAATLERWHASSQPFDIAAGMLELTLDIVARTMFSTEVGGEIAALRRLTDIVVSLRPSTLDLLGLPGWIPRRQGAAYRRAIAEFEALVARLLAERRADGRDRGDLLAMLLAARDPETGQGMSGATRSSPSCGPATRRSPMCWPGPGICWRGTPTPRRGCTRSSTGSWADARPRSPTLPLSNGPAWSSRRPCASTRRRTPSAARPSRRIASAACACRPAPSSPSAPT